MSVRDPCRATDIPDACRSAERASVGFLIALGIGTRRRALNRSFDQTTHSFVADSTSATPRGGGRRWIAWGASNPTTPIGEGADGPACRRSGVRC
jgi:hypothetical protein